MQETTKKESIYTSVQVKKSTLARVKAIVDRENSVPDYPPLGKPLTVSWWINQTLENAAAVWERENEKDGVQ